MHRAPLIVVLLAGLVAVIPVAAARAPLPPSDPAPLALQLVGSGLDLPVYATAPAGDTERVFVLELYAGRVRIVRDGQLLPEPFLDLSGQILGLGERGLLGLAFHPDYDGNGELFVFYNDLAGDTTLARHHVSAGDPDRAEDQGQVLLSLEQHYPEHNGGMLQFGLDGTLYVSTGDGGGALDPENNGQSLDTMLGKILRLDVDGAYPYAIPAGNPFVGVPGIRPEIYCYGLRNPWRFCVDTVTGTLVIADVGADTLEEIDVVPAGTGGQNFGWRCKEGTLCTGLPGCDCAASGFVAPVFQYTHGPACAVIGGFVYRGTRLPGHQGRYFFGDWCTSNVLSIGLAGGSALSLRDHSAELLPPDAPQLLGLSSFGRDGAGELLLTSVTGSVYRVVAVTDCDGDGVSDADEIAAGTAFDANLDGTPDACQLLLQGNGLKPGKNSWLWFIGAQPNQPVLFFASIAGLGAGPCLFENAVCLDLAPFSIGGGARDVLLVAALPADGQGAALVKLSVPPSVLGLESIAFQAVVAAGPASVVSNPLVLPVIP